MNLSQIKSVYENNLNDKLSICFNRIEREMILNFRQIERTKKFSIKENEINEYSNNFNESYSSDMIQGIIDHYADNWSVEYFPETKRGKSHFIFTYIGSPAGSMPHIVHRDTIIVDMSEETTGSRINILDL